MRNSHWIWALSLTCAAGTALGQTPARPAPTTDAAPPATPAATPAPILARLREALLSVTRDKEFVARVERDGGRVLDLSPTQQQAFMRDEIDHWSKLVTQYGVTAD